MAKNAVVSEELANKFKTEKETPYTRWVKAEGLDIIPSFYVQNASVTDATLAPKGQSTLYVLLPVTHETGNVNWRAEAPRYRELALRQMEAAGNLNNLRLAIAGATDAYRGPVFMDSDIYKVLEAIGWELGRSPDEGLSSFLAETTALLEKAQQPDGYLNSYIQVTGRPRYSFLSYSHELYCAGHLIQAGIACQRGAADPALLAVARRFNLVYADQVEPPNMMAPNWLDKPLPLHATSGGKAFLAWLSRDERDAILPAELPRYTERTVTDRERLERELAEVRKTEFALCDREYEEFSSGASAAVLNSRRSPIAVVNVWGPAPRNPTRRLREIGREAVKTADEIRDLLD